VFTDRTDTYVGRASIGTLFRPDFRRDSVGLWAAYFSCMLAVYLGLSWVPSMLTGAGFSASVASTGITAFNLGGVAGALAGGVCIARWGSRVSMLLMTGLAVASAGGMSMMEFSSAAPVGPIVIMLTVTGGLINGVQTTMYALAAHVYPAAIRATGVGSAVSFGRTGAVLSGYIGAWALEYGVSSFFAVIAAMMAVCFVALARVRRHVPHEH
jgi:AAHS family 4-hydroxybenzoate transporter-like MFS transporter